MTTISRKFLFLFFLSCIFPLALLYGETPGTVKNSFSISVETGISGGKTDEIVNEHGNLLSLLEWQEALNPFIHTTFGWEYFFKAPEKGPSFFAELGLKAVLPVISGFITDYDYSSDGSINGYSLHNSKSEKNIEGSLSAGINLPLGNFELSGALGFFYRTKFFRGLNGYTQYPANGEAWTGNEDKKYVSGTILSYHQDYYLPALILEGVYNFTDNISTGISGIYYPYGFMNGVDSHHLRNIEFYDYVRAVMGVKAGLFFNLSFSGNKNRMFSNIALFFNYEFLYGGQGTNYQKYTGDYSGEAVLIPGVTPQTKSCSWSLSLKYF